MTPQLAIGFATALGAAIRGNWSPCGESLQAQIHPLGEKSRGNIWGITVAAFTMGSVLAGGILTGMLGAVGSWVFPRMSSSTALLFTAALAVVAGGLDLSPLSPRTPRRQVNETWIGRYRGWVYGLGFGVQLGLGFVVFVMSWGYYAMLGAALLTRSPLAAGTLGATFGLGRGVLLFLSRWITTPERLAIFHRRMQTARQPAFVATAILTVAVGAVAIL